MSVSVDIRDYEALTRDELYDILHLRCEVFVVEQESRCRSDASLSVPTPSGEVSGRR